jgi:hypothetical protein
MKQSRRVFLSVFVALMLGFVLACNVLFSGPQAAVTLTPAASNTPVAPTATARPSSTPKPTATLVPTPAPVGETVRSESYEVTVISAKELRRVYMGNYYYYPKAGQMFVEVVAKVKNLTGSKTSVPYRDIYMVEDTGDSWYANWAGFKAVSTGKTVEGSTIGVNDTLDGNGTVDFEEDVFIRAIWFLTKKDKTTLLFGFADSPSIIIVIE